VKITVNGEPRLVVDELTLDVLVQELSNTSRGCAAAVDGEVVPKSEWTTYRVRPGQSVEVLNAVQGG
jgi:sulfur carrier protein